MSIYRFFLVILLLYFLYHSVSFTQGISSPNGAMYLSNLKIGQEYSLKQILGFPFQVRYQGIYPVDLKIELEKPSSSTPDGYEPIPDLSWIQIERQEFSLDPGETAETDILIRIPNDESLLGKKFNVNIMPRTGPPKGGGGGIVFAVGITCRLSLAIAPKPPTIEEIREQQRKRFSGYVDISVTPNRIFIYDIEPNKVYNLTKQFNETIKVVNTTSLPVNVELEIVPALERGIFLTKGQYELPSLSLLTVKPKKAKLKPDSVKSFELILSSQGLETQTKYLAVVKSTCLQ